MSVNGGNQTVPTLLFPDGSAATNPSIAQVRAPGLSPHPALGRARSAQRGPPVASIGPPNQCSMIRREIDSRPDMTTDPSATRRGELFAGEPPGLLDLLGLQAQVGAEGARGEAEHQR